MPVRTSPLPEVPRPTSALSSRQARPSGAAMCPYRVTTASCRVASSAAAAARSSPGSRPSRCAASVVFGVSTTRSPRPASRSGCPLSAPRAYASRTIGVPGRMTSSTRRSSVVVSPMSSRPGPMATTSALPASSSRCSGTSPATEPESVSGRPTTLASGTAMLSAGAVVAVAPSWSRPAPARSAASPARSTAPGGKRGPPPTRTVPRDSLPPAGSGSGQARSSCGVTTCSDGLDIDLGLPGGWGALAVQVRHRVEQLGPQPVAVATPRAERGVRDGVFVGDLHQAVLVQALDQVPDEQHDRLVADQQDPAPGVVGPHVAQQAAQPQDDVGPGLAARWPVVELAEPAAPLRLGGQPGPHAVPGEQVEHAEFAVAQPLVRDGPHIEAGQGQLGGLPGAQVRRDDGHLRPPVGRLLAQPSVDGRRLAAPGVRQGYVRIALGDVDELDA